jgi:hypothetical protein
MNVRMLLVAGALSAFASTSVAIAEDTSAPAPGPAAEQATGNPEPGPAPTDTLKTGMDPHCKEILANQPKHTAQEIAKCGKPAE